MAKEFWNNWNIQYEILYVFNGEFAKIAMFTLQNFFHKKIIERLNDEMTFLCGDITMQKLHTPLKKIFRHLKSTYLQKRCLLLVLDLAKKLRETLPEWLYIMENEFIYTYIEKLDQIRRPKSSELPLDLKLLIAISTYSGFK